MPRTRRARTAAEEMAAYNDLTPEEFGEQVGRLTAAKVCEMIRGGELAALNLSQGKGRPTYAIPKSEVTRFRRERMLNAHLIEADADAA